MFDEKISQQLEDDIVFNRKVVNKSLWIVKE